MENENEPRKENAQERKSERGIVFLFHNDGTPFVNVIAKDWPTSQFDEFDKDCKLNYSDVRWAKIMADHEKAKMFDILVKNKKIIVQPERPAEVKKKTEEDEGFTLSGDKY